MYVDVKIHILFPEESKYNYPKDGPNFIKNRFLTTEKTEQKPNS